MTLAIFIVIAALIALVVIVRIASSRTVPTTTVSALASRLAPIDVEAFRNLTDPSEDEYLLHRLSASQFRKVRRIRLLATASYVIAAGKNAAVMAHAGQAALSHPDPETAQAARQLVEEALLLRRNATFLLARIYLSLALPHFIEAAPLVADYYDRVSMSALLLGRLQNPALPVRLSSAIH